MEKTIHPFQLGFPHTYICKICGKPDNLGYYNESCELLDYMAENHVCYHCAYWLQELHKPNREVIGGKMYVFYPCNDLIPEDGRTAAYSGASAYIFRNDQTYARSYNVALIGEIPKHMLKSFPDTARFITARIYRKMMLGGLYKCRAKGCWDRYRCFRYNIECEKDGAFNVIPDNYQIGNEKCPSFIDKNDFHV